MKPVHIGLLGLGTVGQGVAAILERNAAEIERRAGRPIRVLGAVVRNVDKARSAAFDFHIDTDGAALVADPRIDMVVELIGGEQPALEWMSRAIALGKPVITANKALIAHHGNGLFASAREHGVSIGFEAAVAGGIPVIKAIREGLVANRLEWLAGIINGTGNYILSEMAAEGRAFADVLAEAQALGYAEADPSFDIEGIDAAHKLAILASIAFGIPLQFDGVYTEGIAGISREDVSYARQLGYVIKHLGIARRREDGFELRVHPTLIPERRLLASVDGVMNAVELKGDAVGPTLYYGPGAGAEPTGSAVIADIVDAVRALDTPVDRRVPSLAFQSGALSDAGTIAPQDFESAYYLRLAAEDKPGVLADIASIFGDLGVSIEALIQKEPDHIPVAGENLPVPSVPMILLSRRVREGLIRQAIDRVDALPSVSRKVTMIRVETLG